MAKQWVDITTIDNNTPFTKVRWKWKFAGSQYDAWFAESPGIVSDNMSWFEGTSANGWFSAHRMNNGYGGGYRYCCSFIHSGSGFWDVSGIDYGVSVKDADRNLYYDNVVTISGETYYEIDFSTWSGATGVNLYAPYSTMPWSAGDIYVEVGSDPVVVTPSALTFDASGGTQYLTIDFSGDDHWISAGGDSWLSFTPVSGGTGQTTVAVTAQANTGTSRSTLISFAEYLHPVTTAKNVTIYQRSGQAGGVQGVYLGDVPITEIYLGDIPISSLMLGDAPIF